MVDKAKTKGPRTDTMQQCIPAGSPSFPSNGKRCDDLKDMCRDYGLNVSGNKKDLTERLREFSKKFCEDPGSCNLGPGKRRSHKGPREGIKKTKPKKSANRRAVIIDADRVTERSKDSRTTDEMKEMVLWVISSSVVLYTISLTFHQ
ncbi:hypothetical protein B0H10DRAFT_2089474 [Mycena sp. CBHHK59/15]|nr:hypothetical protein B0H10DRAFT_2089474 [Mycena sp. CBHHK59/15]